MADALNIVEHIESQFFALEQGLNGSASLPFHQKRKEALAALSANGLPGLRDEEYKYTKLAKAAQKALAGFSANPAGNVEDLKSNIPFDLSPLALVYVNGIYNESLSTVQDVDGLTIEAISSETKADSTNFSSLASVEKDAYVAANTALAASGSVLKVAKNKVIETPILIVHAADSAEGAVMTNPRHLVEVEGGAQVSIIEYNLGRGAGAAFSNSVTEITVAANAHVDYYKIGNNAEEHMHVGTTQVRQEGDSTFTATTVNLDGKMIRNNLNIELTGSNGEANMNGLYLTKGKTHVDNHTVVDHKVPHCNSNELYKGIMDGQSTGVFNGKIFVREDAQKTNAFQSNKNILLSDDATINTKPQLEIWADDVKCSHGCTTGKIDPEQLFYLRARGIDEPNAQALLLKAFAEEVIERIKIEPLKDHIEHILEERIKA